MPVMLSKVRNFGKGGRPCRRCIPHDGVIRSHSVMPSHRCFRDISGQQGFRNHS